jgi:general secretion pathway protein I
MTPRSRAAGFTLIETMIATVIMAGALIVIGSAWSGNYMRIEKARTNANMASLLDRKMTEIDLEYRDKPLSEIKDEDSGDFSEEYKQYRWEMHSREFEMPDFGGLLGGGTDGDSKKNEFMALIVKTVTEYVKTAVKEVTVTVYYKSPRSKTREIRQSVATYFVDYKKPISIPGLPGGASGTSSATSGGKQ